MATRPLSTRRGLAAPAPRRGRRRPSRAALLGLAAGHVGRLPLGAQGGAATRPGRCPGRGRGAGDGGLRRRRRVARASAGRRRAARGTTDRSGIAVVPGARRAAGVGAAPASRRPARSARRHARRAWSSRRRRATDEPRGGRLPRHARRGPDGAETGAGRWRRAADSASCQVLRGRAGADAAARGRLRRSSGGAAGAEAALGGDRRAAGRRPRRRRRGAPARATAWNGAAVVRGPRSGGRQRGRAGGVRDGAGTGGSGQPGARQLAGASGGAGRGERPTRRRSDRSRPGAVGWSLSPAAGPRHSASGTSVRRRPAATGACPGPVRHCLIRRACPR